MKKSEETKESIASLKDAVGKELSTLNLDSGIESAMAKTEMIKGVSDVSENKKKNKKDEIIRKPIKIGTSSKLVSSGKMKTPIGKLYSMGKSENKEATGASGAGPYSGQLFSASKQEMEEVWSEKYKKSIDCTNPKGFSQKAHCQGRKKEETKEACWKGYKEIGGKKKNGKIVPNCVKEGKEEYCDSCDNVKSKCVCGNTKKVETKEATGASSSGQYSTPASWAKSTSKKDWRGKSKTQIPGGKFVQVKEKCKKFPYCNQGDIKALKIFENEMVKKVISKLSEKHNISENVIKNIIYYEYQKIKSNK